MNAKGPRGLSPSAPSVYTVDMRFNVRFLLLYAMPYVAGLGTVWALTAPKSMTYKEFPATQYKIVLCAMFTGLWLVGTLCCILAREVIRKWRTK